MDQHSRPSRAAGRDQIGRHDSREQPSASHHPREVKDSSRTRTQERTHSHRDLLHAKPRDTPEADKLYEDQESFQRWLAEMDNLTNQSPAAYNQTHEREERGQLAHSKSQARSHPQRVEGPRGRSRKRKHGSFSDSSIIPEPTKPRLQQVDRRRQTAGTQKRRRDSREPLQHRSAEPAEPTPSEASTPVKRTKETFEKRPRHKTREDKYEPKSRDKQSKKDGKVRKTREKTGRRDRQRTAKKSGEDLMQKFTSRSLGQERITVRPTQSLGLFNNGRASSPNRRRGLSDLQFSEMRFLQSSNRQPQPETTNAASSKSRGKQSRKTAKHPEDIREAFRAMRKPSMETSLDPSEEQSPRKPPAKRSIYVKQIEQSHRQKDYDSIKSLDSRERPYVGVRHPSHHSERLSSYHGRSLDITDHERPQSSHSQISEKATTYVSWSETRSTPSITHYQQILHRVQRSPTPEAVRRSLANTGVFNGTGILRYSLLTQDDSKSSSRSESNLPKSASACDRMRTSTAPGRPPQQRSSRSKARPSMQLQTEITKENTRKKNAYTHTDRVDGGLLPTTTTRKRVIIEHFDPELGWQESIKQSFESPKIPAELPPESRSAPIDRLEIAKAARVKRPSTTIPLSRPGIQARMQEAVSQSVNTEDPRPMTRNDDQERSLVQLIVDGDRSTHESKQDNASQEIRIGHDENPSQCLTTQAKLDSQANISSAATDERHYLGNKETLECPNNSVSAVHAEYDPTSSTYLGLPIRGSWHPSCIEQPRQPTPIQNIQPYFAYQLQHEQTPRHLATALSFPEVCGHEIFDLPRIHDSDLMLQTYAFELDDHAGQGDLGVDYYDNIDVETFEQIETQEDYLNPDAVYEAALPYDIQYQVDPVDAYESNAMIEDEYEEEPLDGPFEVDDQVKHDMCHDDGDYGQMVGFWRAQRQY